MMSEAGDIPHSYEGLPLLEIEDDDNAKEKENDENKKGNMFYIKFRYILTLKNL